MQKLLLIVMVLSIVTSQALAQPYPNRPIKMIAPFPPGGGTDVPARILANELSQRLGQQIVVENRPGASGNIGAEIAAKSPKDGYTVLLASVNIVSINPLIYPSMPFDSVRDLAPISMCCTSPNVLVVGADTPIRSFEELLRAAKEEPGKLTFASAGSGTTLHLAGELLKTMAGIDMVHIPYKGAPIALPDIITGKVTTMFVSYSTVASLIEAGRLRALAVSSKTRLPALPNVRTIDEAGVTGFDVVPWIGLFAPAGTPQGIIAKLNAEVIASLANPDVRAKLREQGLEAASSTPAELGRAVVADREKYADVVRRSGAKLD